MAAAEAADDEAALVSADDESDETPTAGLGAVELVARVGESCSAACSREKRTSCDEAALRELNACAALQRSFTCRECGRSQGIDQPAFVKEDAPAAARPGSCLVNGDTPTCAGTHKLTMRLCACVKPTG